MKRALIADALVAGVLAFLLSSCATAPEGTSMGDPAPKNVRLEVNTLEYKTEIAAPAEKVWETLFSPESYTKWTAPFMAGSYFEGSWAEGERIRFLAPGGSGMLAEIAENRTHEFMSIKHIGFVQNGVDDTTSDGVLSWAPAYENYRLASVPGGTLVTIEQDVVAGYEDSMNKTWPKALAELKSLCEAD